MEYIIFDLEFNQGFDKKLNKTVSNEKCPFEII
ncbi:exonuclease, partial [Clostridioides difficile]|nr:exonuclease [Clostridioides difficile]